MSSDPTARTLRLLSMLQSRPRWSAEELCRRLDVSARTLRRDTRRLRELGYSVQAPPGPGSRYQLVPGVEIPPLLFSPDEISVIVSGLRLAQARLDVDAAGSALAKLDQVLPPTLRRRAAATDLAMEVLGDLVGPAAADIGVLADAISTEGRVRFRYTDQHGHETTRTVEPYRHLLRDAHWYLVAYDIDRDDWRTYRFDRIEELERVPGVFAHRPFPAESIPEWFSTDFGRRAPAQPTSRRARRPPAS